jgi:hypothetical protein
MLREIDQRRAAEADLYSNYDEYDSYSDDSDLDRESLSYHLMLKNKISGSGYFDNKNRGRYSSSNRIDGSSRESTYNDYNDDCGGETSWQITI